MNGWLVAGLAHPLLPVLLIAPSWLGGWRSLVLVPLFGGLLIVHWQARSFPLVTDWLFLALLSFLPLSLIPAIDGSVAAGRLTAVLAGMTVYLAVRSRLRTAQGIVTWSVGMVLVVAGLGSIISPFVVEWPLSKSLLPPSVVQISERFPLLFAGQITGTTRGGIHPNQYAGTLVLVLPTALLLALSPALRRRARLVTGAALLAGLVGLLLTQSRSGLLGVTVGFGTALGIWMWRGPNPRNWQRARWVLGVIAIVVTLWLGRILAGWIVTPDPSLDSFASRVDLWHRALLLIADFPITGIGLGQFSLVLSRLAPVVLTPPGTVVPHAHNFILQVTLDLGVLGTLVVASFFGLTLVGLARVVRRPDFSLLTAPAAGMMAGLFGFLAFGLTDAIAITARGAVVLWLQFGLSAAVIAVASHPDAYSSRVQAEPMDGLRPSYAPGRQASRSR